MNIILIGYRGCGKTTIGKQLAAHQWLTFVDVDDQVRQRFDNQTIAQIWDQHGELEWRRVEKEVALALLEKTQHVIALGGGTLMEPAVRRAVLEAKEVVRIYLFCEAQKLSDRINQDPDSQNSRPALTRLGGTVEEITQVLVQRDPIYRAVADKVLDVTHLRCDNTVRYLVEKCL